MELSNTGNVPVSIKLSADENITLDNDNVSMDKGQSEDISIKYVAPHDIGAYVYAINISNITDYVTINVTHQATIISVNDSTGLAAGDLIRIGASANYLGILLVSDVEWDVTVDGLACFNISYNYTDKWEIECKVPVMQDNMSHTIQVDGLFQAGHALHSSEVYYLDVFGPTIVNYTESALYVNASTQINATARDDNALADAAVNVYSSNNETFTPNATINGNIITIDVNLTEIGDYVLNYTLTYNLSNTRIKSVEFELYKEVDFRGRVIRGNGSGVSGIIFRLYKNEEDTPWWFNSDTVGQYNTTVHERIYSYFEVE